MTQSNHPIPSIIFSHLPSTGTAILVLSLPLFAQDTSTVTQSKTIVQEGNKVELVADASLDEALDRRPDLAFSNISLDQENSGVSLSSIPAESVAKAEVLKSATPDLDADTRGSILRVKYKPSYELEKRILNGRVFTRYKDLYQSFGSLGDISWAQPIGENAGIRATFEAENVERGADSYDVDWGDAPATSTGAPFIDRITQTNSRRDYVTYSFNGSADYRFSEGNDVYLRLAYEDQVEDGILSTVQLRYGNEADFSSLTPEAGRTTNGRLSRFGSHWREVSEELNFTLGGNNTLGAIELEWRAQRNHQQEDEIFDHDVRFIRNGLDFGYANAEAKVPTAIYPTHDGPERYPAKNYDYSTDADEFTTEIAAIDLSWDDGFLKSGDYLKVGIKSSSDRRDVTRNLQAYDVKSSATIRLSDALSPFTRDDFLGEGFSPGAVPDGQLAADYLNSNPDVLELDALQSARRTFPGSYGVQQDIDAAYTMVNWQGERLRVVAGLRYEDTQLSALGNSVVVNGATFEVQPNRASNRYDQIFPGLHLQYKLTSDLTFFGSSTKTIKRPSFSYTAPFRVLDIEDSEITEGTPGLRATLYQNYNVALDYQPNHDFLVSGSIFYRDITDPVYREREQLTTGEFAGFELRQLRNGDPSSQYGAKVMVQHDLGALNPELEPWSWSLAYSYRDSAVAYPQRPGETLPLIGAATDHIDSSISFRGDRSYVQLGVDYRSESFFGVGETGPFQDRYSPERVLLNLKAEHKLNAKLTAFVDWKNLLREYETNIVDGPTRRASYATHDPWAVLAGMRFKM
ncbi:MAG: TonB-dependent receptor [Opitutaceae bacterium]|jgi:TonB-dependent receptor|nr:TonB-dependent receptor [Opitutaceae bacterium]